MAKLTTIDLPNAAMDIARPILEEAGFTEGTFGGGWFAMEREGEISDEESAELTKKISDALIDFEVQDIPEDDEDADESLG